jgi:hypothetical protein
MSSPWHAQMLFLVEQKEKKIYNFWLKSKANMKKESDL